MWTLNYLNRILCCALIQCFILEIGSISNNPREQQIEITEEERRAAGKLEDRWRPYSINDEKLTEARTQAVFVSDHQSRATFNIPPGYGNRHPGSIENQPNDGRQFPYFVTGSYPTEYNDNSDHNSQQFYGLTSGAEFHGSNGGGSGYGVQNFGQTPVTSSGNNDKFGILKNGIGIKGLLIPLAGLALLGAAAALTANPVLLQLGVIGGGRRRRRRRSLMHLDRDVYPENPFIKPDEK